MFGVLQHLYIINLVFLIVIFQLGLVEREVHEVLNGHLTRQSPKTGDSILSSTSCDQRPIAPDDVCPICQEELIEKPQRLSYCK